METVKLYVIVFDSTHSAIAAETMLKEENIANEVIPTPREITASCGLSIRFNIDSLDKVKNILKQGSVSVNGVYKLERRLNEKQVEKLM
ncbi:DUF3343 domain-containing protein [Alkaliphilus pronyensis]|uniref:DUF3343 domain-containing protein n=1 Tax=Alkaliphilus pronyensis TaxID=1482732 RepID=A0A6I0FHG7_9FIRM|nr:DUF3343 domain-containing protein [Alkaliphilus pronyensis]KAB3537848.1 DUF3343 domain-containing protein [Alkaliphilus pronyensis]